MHVQSSKHVQFPDTVIHDYISINPFLYVIHAVLIVDFKVLDISPRILQLAESSIGVPQIGIELNGSSVGTLYFHVLPLTYDEYEARFPDIDLDDIFQARPLNPAGGNYEAHVR